MTDERAQEMGGWKAVALQRGMDVERLQRRLHKTRLRHAEGERKRKEALDEVTARGVKLRRLEASEEQLRRALATISRAETLLNMPVEDWPRSKIT